MKTPVSILLIAITIAIVGCKNDSKKTFNETTSVTDSLTSAPKKDSILFSFTFLGCNRVDRHQEYDTTATNGSTANLYVLERIFREVANEKRQPDIFFFLGDMVLGESTVEKLDHQLNDWVSLYDNPNFSSIKNIEMVAVPGNHEMLYYHDYNVPGHDEWPLKGATETWMKHMHSFMPNDRDYVTGKDSINNQMTFAFKRKNIGFVLMNTDTYNTPTKENPYGLEGQIPTQWVIDKVAAYQKDPSIAHVFVLGHKPYYISGKPETGHAGLPAGPILWPKLNEHHVAAMLSAHLHDYQRMQPGNEGTYQIIAGNAGSKGSATFFGYSTINILSNGKIQLISKGFDKGNPYYFAVPENPTVIRDSTTLSWSKNANPYHN